MDGTVRDGSVNVGTIKYFDGVMMQIPEADKIGERVANCNCCVRRTSRRDDAHCVWRRLRE